MQLSENVVFVLKGAVTEDCRDALIDQFDL